MVQVQSKQWNLEKVRPGEKEISEQIDQLMKRMDQLTSNLEEQSYDTSTALNLISQVQNLHLHTFEMDEYIICQLSENVHDEKAQMLSRQCNVMNSKMKMVMLAFQQFLARIPDDKIKEIEQHPEIKEIEFFITAQRQKIKDQLDHELEQVIQSLSANGFDGWEEQYELEFSKLTIPVDGETLPFDKAFMLAMLSNDRSVRKKVAAAMNEVCQENTDRFASIFNHFAGYRNELYRLRGWDPLKEMYEQNRISEASVNGMMQALHRHKNLLHRYLQRKAEVNKLETLSWFDSYAPTFTSKTTLTYEQAAQIVTSQFYSFSEKMGRFAEQAFEQGWIDAVPSDGKRHGAFCASFPNAKESRVLLSFTGNYQDVVTLAHELGHAYHNLHLHDEPGFAQQIGTGLAETASTFAENLVLDAAIDLAETEEDRLSLLEMKITNGLKYIAYIPAKFEFEQQFYEKRRSRQLSASELVQLMEKTERDWFEDSLEEVNAYNWMTIPHFYNTEKAFYNLPYTIGYLFSNGVYSLYLQDKEDFPERYDELLENSGKKTMEELGAQYLNQNLAQSHFWEASIQPLKEAIFMYLEKTEVYL